MSIVIMLELYPYHGNYYMLMVRLPLGCLMKPVPLQEVRMAN
ncbi:hypothetical protein [Marinobacter sp.]